MTRCRTPRRRGALLLEAIVALTILVLALGFMGAQLVNGLKLTGRSDETTRAVQFGERMLALLELEPAVTASFFNARSSDGDFGDENPGWFWRASVEKMQDFEGLGLLTLEILHQPDPRRGDTIDDAQVVRRLRLIKADPGRINLAEDFGFDEEALAQLSETVPIPGFDPTQLDPQAIVGMDPGTLMQLLPVLLPIIQQFAAQQGMQLPEGGLENMTPEQLQELLQQGGGGRGAGAGRGEDGDGGDLEGPNGTQSGPGGTSTPRGNRAQPPPPGGPGAPQNINGLNGQRNQNNGRFPGGGGAGRGGGGRGGDSRGGSRGGGGRG